MTEQCFELLFSNYLVIICPSVHHADIIKCSRKIFHFSLGRPLHNTVVVNFDSSDHIADILLVSVQVMSYKIKSNKVYSTGKTS